MGDIISKLEDFSDIGKIETLYHGTVTKHLLSIQEKIDCQKSEFTKYFGKGFYLTTNLSHAMATAKNVSKTEDSSPVVIEFKLNKKYIKNKYSILIFDSSDAEWLGFIFSNKNPRKVKAVTHFPNKFVDHYDIVYGPLADGIPYYLALINEFEKLDNITDRDKIDLLKAIRKGYKFPEVDQIMLRNQKDINQMLKIVNVLYVK